MSSADNEDENNKREIPAASRGFVNIANISALDLLEVEENNNGITTDPTFVDENHDGVNDRDEYNGGHKLCVEFVEACRTFVANIVKELLFGSSLDTTMNDRSWDRIFGGSFNYMGLITTTQQRRTLEASGERLEDAIRSARAKPDTDNFLNLCDARMERKIAATEMIMNDAAARGDTDTYDKAVAFRDKFMNIRHDIAVVQTKLAGETDEAKKEAEVKALLPTMWARYKNGELTTSDGGLFNAWRPDGRSPDADGEDHGFWSTLSGLFRLAGFHLPSGPAPASAPPPLAKPAFQPV